MSKNLDMAYAMKKKNTKKMAQGGLVNESAKTEHRPMPDEQDKDAKMVSRNSGNKAPKDDSVSSNVTVRQAQKPSLTRLSQPKIVGSDAFSVRNMNQRDENNDQIDSFYPESAAQPRKRYDEYGANRQGPSVPALKMKMMAEGGPVMEPMDHGQEMEEREDEAHMMTELSPGEHDEQPASWRDEEGANRQGPSTPSLKMKMMADGGSIDEEEEMEHEASIASAIMARDKRKMMADGGMVDIESNGQEDSNQFHERSEAALKENYDSDLMDVSQPEDSNEHGHTLSDEDVNNMSKIEKIMARMSKRSPITK